MSAIDDAATTIPLRATKPMADRSSIGSSMKSFGWRVFGWGIALTVVVVVGGFILRSFGAVAA
ncbi:MULTISPECIES: hypothetical protein [unclassified Frigoribacterium]|uniref:hypothetical protein n=1 Tax=unclassified Frigoribacterium TaxID=2627005 RepID=UPI00106224A0|nr:MULTISPECIES: hypothetical protein [unclassified Frigoribacterium]